MIHNTGGALMQVVMILATATTGNNTDNVILDAPELGQWIDGKYSGTYMRMRKGTQERDLTLDEVKQIESLGFKFLSRHDWETDYGGLVTPFDFVALDRWNWM